MSHALHPLLNVRPEWRALRSGGDALGLQPREMLHAGPPLADPRRPPHTLASSVVMTCLHERWAASEAEAEDLLHGGALSLTPAQDRGCVTPLAALVSAGTPLFEVGDAAGHGQPCFAPVGAVRGADTRMGWRDPTLPARLHHRDSVVVPALSALIAQHGPLALWPLAAVGLAAGDDLHGSTAHANQALTDALRQRAAPPALTDDIGATPLFFLTLWMAACALMLRAAEGQAPHGLVTRAGGNGERFAIALAGRPGHWTSCDAASPSGPRLASVARDVSIEGAIGDSAVIDMLGLGGQRLARSPELMAAFREHPDAVGDLTEASPPGLKHHAHPLLADGWHLGLDARAIVDHRQPPRVMLAMLARDGHGGLCGRGIYRPPLSLFERALDDVA